MGFPQGDVAPSQVIQHVRGLRRVMLQEIVSAGKVCGKQGLLLPRRSYTIRPTPGTRKMGVFVGAVRFLPGTSPLHRVVSVLSGAAWDDATLHRTHRLLSKDDRDHVPSCQLLVECASTIKIACRYNAVL